MTYGSVSPETPDAGGFFPGCPCRQTALEMVAFHLMLFVYMWQAASWDSLRNQ